LQLLQWQLTTDLGSTDDVKRILPHKHPPSIN